MKITVNKNANNPFVQLYKEIFSDERLSWKAKGIWAYLLSKPENWIYRIEDIVRRSSDKHSSVYAGLKELEKVGYLVRKKSRDNKGRFTQSDFIIYEQLPCKDYPYVENPDMDNPYLENQTVSNNDYSNIDFNNNKTTAIDAVAEKEVIAFLEQIGLSKNKILEFLQRYSLKRLQNNILFIKKQNKSNIKNFAGFAINCIKNNEQLNDFEKQKLRKMTVLQTENKKLLGSEESYDIKDPFLRKFLERNIDG